MLHKDIALTTSYQTLPVPLFLNNTSASNVTLTFKPPGNLSPMKTSANVLADIIELPTLQKAAASFQYTTTSSGLGSGAKVAITVSDVGSAVDDAFPVATGAVFSGTVLLEGKVHTPTTNGSGEGLRLYMRISGTVLSQVVYTEIYDHGTGYAAGDVLTFTNSSGSTFTYTLQAGDITDLFQPSAATIPSGQLGANYKAGDELYVTLTETVSTVVYNYPIKIRIKAASLGDLDSTFVLKPGETTPFAVQEVKAGASVTLPGFTQ